MSQQRRAVGNTVSDFYGWKFEPQTSRFIGERLTARPTGRSLLLVAENIVSLKTLAEFVIYLFMFDNERLLK